MSLVKQVGLLAAGCQPWNADVCAASGDRFAYCATLAVYIFQLDRKFNEFKLISIMSEHKKTITAISWNPRNVDLFASSSSDSSVIVWNVAEQKIVSRLNNTRNPACSIGWCLHEKDCVSFVYGKGPLFMWNYGPASQVTPHKDAQNFMSEICQFRWHPKKTGKLAFGHNDGSVSLFCPGKKVWKHVLRPDDLEGTDEEDPVTALEWDPLSMEYLLITNTHYGVRLLDTEGVSVIMKFHLPSAAAQVHTLAWISSAPGMFVTGDSHTGVMRLWNVSKSTPIENIRLKKTGFHALHVFSTAPGKSSSLNSNLDSPNHMSAMPAAVSATSRYALPPAHAVCTFLDGGVGLYDLGRRKWSFLRDMGHVETIFDCKFKPDNPDQLATASFDGTIKIWDVNTLEPVDSSPGNEGIIYCLSWAPADLNCVAASTSKNGAFIWDINKGKVVKRFMEHNKSSVYTVAWNQKDSRRIATCGGDSYCIIRQVDGKLLMKYKHPSPVFGCDWSPHNKDMLATGCEDKLVRVYYMATTNDQPLKVFAGHQAKVFQVRWSSLREGLLCSGADDNTIRIWDYTQDCCMTVLSGHKGPVRGLLWSTEIPYLLISGSWDYTIRVWDIRDGAEIDTILDHGADVYGLTIHPDRPFTLASSSRDSTVRIWSLTPLTQPLEINILTQKPWEDILTNPATKEIAVSQGAPPLLVGKASRDIKAQLDKRQGNNRANTLQLFSKFFSSPRGTNNLWELVSVILGMGDDYLSPDYSKGIMHMKHLTKYKAAEAQELEMVKMSKFGGGLGAPNREDRLRDAANIHVRLGNLQKYCEILAELGEWDKAIAVAPGVSLQYWKSLAERRGKALIQEDSDDTIPYCAATGNAELLVKFFTSRGQLTDAMMAATSAYEGVMIPPEGGRKRGSKAVSQNGMAGETEENLSLLKHTSEALADWHFRNGAPILAACCHLAVEDCKRAMCKLIRGNELELAVSVGLAMETVQELTQVAALYLARRCERIGKWELGVDLIKAVLSDPDLALASICARCAASMAEINDLHHKAGFPSMDDCLVEAEKLAIMAGSELQCVKYYLLSTAPEKGIELGVRYAKGKMSSSGWQIDDIFDMLHLMGSIQTEKLQQHKCNKWRGELLVLCAYVGALVAVRRRYDSIVPALFRHTHQMMKKDGVDVPLSESLVSLELDAWLAHQAVQACYDPSTPSRPDVAMTVEQQQTYEDLLRKAGEERGPVEVGPDTASGSQLPSHSDVHVSCITGHRIQGAGFFLEDGKSAISLNDAVMWAKVNPFSPLGSGVRINPF